MPSGNVVKAVFLDRDGVLNRDTGYAHKPADMQLLPGVPEALKVLKDRGYLLVVVTNQSGVARGFYDVAAVDTFHAAMQNALKPSDVQLDAFYLCPHLDGCDCRKPKPGMVLQAAREHGIELGLSYMVGDKASDITCAIAAGVRPIQIGRDGEAKHPGAFTQVADLAAAATVILSAAKDLS